MKVKLMTSMAGANESYNVGEIIDVDAAYAKRLIERGFAEKVATPRKKKGE